MTRMPYAVPDDGATPFPVDLDRVQRTLHDMGYTTDVLVEGHTAGAVFDDVPFLFSFDSQERFLSVRAVWDTDLDPEASAQPLFAAADNWNREKYFPTIYRVTAPDGTAQVCADFVLDTAPGVSDAQLVDNLAAGISTGITAIGYMKQAAAHTLR